MQGGIMPRLFIAIDMPDELRGKICELRRNLPGTMWTNREQMHMTLRFIGDSDDEHFEKIRSSLSEIRFKPFHLEMTGSGFFPNERRPSVFWLGCMENPELSKLKDSIDDILEMNDVPRELRKFTPHMTIARLKEIPANQVAKLREIYKDILPQKFPVGEFILYSSVLTSDGAIHAREKTYMSG